MQAVQSGDVFHAWGKRVVSKYTAATMSIVDEAGIYQHNVCSYSSDAGNVETLGGVQYGRQ